jgi:hypothetical protein
LWRNTSESTPYEKSQVLYSKQGKPYEICIHSLYFLNIDFWLHEQLPYEFLKGGFMEIQIMANMMAVKVKIADITSSHKKNASEN